MMINIYSTQYMVEYFMLKKILMCTSFLGCSLKPHCTPLYFSEYNTNAVAQEVKKRIILFPIVLRKCLYQTVYSSLLRDFISRSSFNFL